MRLASCQAQTGQRVAPFVDSGWAVGSRHSTHSAYGGPSAPSGGAGATGSGASQYVSSMSMSTRLLTASGGDPADEARRRRGEGHRPARHPGAAEALPVAHTSRVEDQLEVFSGLASLGRTMTKPSPWSISWTASPDPPRTIEPTLCERFRLVVSCWLQPTTASVSTYTG